MKPVIRIPLRAIAALERCWMAVNADLTGHGALPLSPGDVLALLIDRDDRVRGGPGVFPADAGAYESTPSLSLERRVCRIERHLGLGEAEESEQEKPAGDGPAGLSNTTHKRMF